MTAIPPLLTSTAVFSIDRRNRYSLRRIWSNSRAPVLFVGLNPSTADTFTNDPTIRRCMRFAHDWGYGGIIMGNLFVYRATDPKLLVPDHPVIQGYNDRRLLADAEDAGLVVAAWGSSIPSGHKARAAHVRELLSPVHVLGFTKYGHPRHPLYMPGNAVPILWDTDRGI